jgi:hypothetical protein
MPGSERKLERQRGPHALARLVAVARATLESLLMNNTPKTFVESMRELCADDVRLRELALLNPVGELVPAILATLADLPEDWPLRPEQLP